MSRTARDFHTSNATHPIVIAPEQSQQLPHISMSNATNASHIISTSQASGAVSYDITQDPIPEPPTQITYCSHIFGRHCLTNWFSTSTSNRCPTCNQALFPARCIHLSFREPTRAMRIQFVKYVEGALGDPVTAAEIRENLMSEWSKILMREFAIEMYIPQGFEVTWEYLDVCGEGEEDGEESEKEQIEDEEMFESDGKEEDGEEMDSQTQSEDEDSEADI